VVVQAGGAAVDVRGAGGGAHQVVDQPAQAGGVGARVHGRHLSAGPVQDGGADGVALDGVGVEEAIGRGAVQGSGELSAEVHGVADTEVEFLAAQR
jgi:hypothetical protein